MIQIVDTKFRFKRRYSDWIVYDSEVETYSLKIYMIGEEGGILLYKRHVTWNLFDLTSSCYYVTHDFSLTKRL